MTEAGSIASAWRRAAAVIRRGRAGGTPELDARLLAAFCLGLDATAFFAREGEAFPPERRGAFDALVARRAAGEPVARIFGRKEFHGLEFRLSPATLVPRPETETLVETALELLEGVPAPLVADLGTGSGCIAVAILHAREDCQCAGVDISFEAVLTACRNARNLGVRQRFLPVAGDWASALSGRFDMIVSNPPYIGQRECAALPAEVREHDPAIALFAGEDGLDAYRKLVPQSLALLRPGGWLAVETGHVQGGAVAMLMRAAGYADPAIRTDLGGRDRVVIGRKRNM